jgi:hypothetical protein
MVEYISLKRAAHGRGPDHAQRQSRLRNQGLGADDDL